MKFLRTIGEVIVLVGFVIIVVPTLLVAGQAWWGYLHTVFHLRPFCG